MRTIRLLIEYDGSDFSGWQVQAQGRTVQAELGRALHILLKEQILPVGSGRTDAGTHALGQVAHFHTRSDLPCERLLRGLNGLLPPDVAIHRAEEVPDHFHARYSATSKRYRYRILQGKAALDRAQVWPLHHLLDLEPMAAAARALPGTHSFGAFCKQDPVPESLLCQILDCTWRQEGRECIFEIEANRFLRHMVRALVGTLAEIGQGRRPPADLEDLLFSGDRSRAGPTAPARGLCLLRVSYPDFPGLLACV